MTPATPAVAIAACVLGLAIVGAQTPPPAQPPAKPLVPVAASTLVADPSPYFGQTVTIYAPVEQRISASAFSVDQDRAKTGDRDLLILTKEMHGTVEPNAYVTIVGEVVAFEPARIAADYLLDLPPDALAKYRGRGAVLATSVITAAVVDLAKRPPAPLTPEEEAYDKVMKRVGPSVTAMRQGIAASNADAVKEQTAVLKQAFADTVAFWKKRGTVDATGWAQEAIKHVAAIEAAAAGAQWDGVKTATSALTQTCQNCHGVYRERLDDGSYRIRSGPVGR
jgi:cytochrome c556